jgi:WD40 repeat protein
VITQDNFESLRIISEADLPNVEFLAWQTDGSLVVASRNQVARLSSGNSALEPLYSVTGQETVVAVSGFGTFATTIDNQSLTVRDLSGAEKGTIATGTLFGSVAFSPDGSQVAISRHDKIAVDVYALPAGSLTREYTGFETAAPVYAARFSQNGRNLVYISRATAQLQDLGSAMLSQRFDHEDFISGLEVSGDGSRLVTTAGSKAFVWQTAGATQVATFEIGSVATQPLFLANQGDVAIAGATEISLWDIATQAQVGVLQATVRQMALSFDGRIIATSDENGHIALWEAA